MLVTQPPDEHTNNAQAANTSPPEPCANADANDVAAAEGGVPLEAEINDVDPPEFVLYMIQKTPKLLHLGRQLGISP